MRRFLVTGGVIAALTMGSVAPAAAIGTIIWDTERAECRALKKAFEKRELVAEKVKEVHEGIPRLTDAQVEKLLEIIERVKLRTQGRIIGVAEKVECIGGTTIP